MRRRSYEIAHGPIPDGKVVITTCRELLCVNPDHLQLVTRGQLIKLSYKETRNTQHEYPRRLAARVAQGGLKLDIEKAREIRASELKAEDEAKRLGVSVSLVHKIRQGKIWREVVQGASVFSMR